MPVSAESLQSAESYMEALYFLSGDTVLPQCYTLSSLGLWCLESCLPCASDHSRAGHQLFPCWAVSLYPPLTLALGSRHYHPLTSERKDRGRAPLRAAPPGRWGAGGPGGAQETIPWLLTWLCSVPQHSYDEGPAVWKLAPRPGGEGTVVRVRLVMQTYLTRVPSLPASFH